MISEFHLRGWQRIPEVEWSRSAIELSAVLKIAARSFFRFGGAAVSQTGAENLKSMSSTCAAYHAFTTGQVISVADFG
jgi:hypothetical protein